MKKLLLLFGFLTFASFSFISCSGDDDGDRDVVDNDLYGTWTIDYILVNGVITEDANLVCSQLLKYRFRNNDTYELTTFAGDDNTDCDESATAYGQWEYLEDDQFLIYPNGVDVEGNEAAYTYVLLIEDEEMLWYTLADYNAGTNSNYIKFEKQ